MEWSALEMICWAKTLGMEAMQLEQTKTDIKKTPVKGSQLLLIPEVLHYCQGGHLKCNPLHAVPGRWHR